MKRALLFLFIISLIVACGAEETPAPTRTARPTRAPIAQPTDAPRTTPVPSATPDPTAELCPLTGIKNPTKPWLTRRPLVIKIDNSPLARPQSGLMSADIVFAHLAEGGITRFDLVYWCGESDTIGPVRSARIIDLDLVAMLQAVLVHVGASNENLAALRQTFGNRLIDGDVDKPLFQRSKDREPPYNTYISTKTLWDAAAQRNLNQTVTLKGLTFAEAAPDGGKPANKITVPYDSRFSDSVWEYVPEQKMYKKFLLGDPLMDATTNQQVQESNVVVIFAPHSVTDIIEDSLGSRSIQIDLKGRGRALVFRDGQAYEGQWVRDDANAMLRLVDANNKDIALKTGRSWFEIVPTDLKVEWK